MTLIADFKTSIGETGSSNDQFYLDYYIKEAIHRATVLSTNTKHTTITLTSGVQTYDLTSSLITSPVVSVAGIQDIVIDDAFVSSLAYKVDFYLSDVTTLYIPKLTDAFTGTIAFNYNEYWTIPTTAPVETNLPTKLWGAVMKYSEALYWLAQIRKGSTSSGIEKKREENLEVSYGSIDSRQKALMDSIKQAEQMMISAGASSRLFFNSIQVI